MSGKLIARLKNWGRYIYDVETGPENPCCMSIESTHIPDAGDVFDEPGPMMSYNAADAEQLAAMIRTLESMEQYCLTATVMDWLDLPLYPVVFRTKRVGDGFMERNTENALVKLELWLEKSA